MACCVGDSVRPCRHSSHLHDPTLSLADELTAGPQNILPTDPKARKEVPVASGFMDYFPDAIIAVARLSMKANNRHNPGEPLHWSKHKSTDHADCLERHFLQRGQHDAEWDESHTVEMAWRAMALLQIEIEAKRAGLSPSDYIKKLTEEANAVHP